MGTPNACNQCHKDKDPAWAVAALKRWGMGNKPGAQTFAESFARADEDGPGATDALLGVAKDGGQSAIARASALKRLNGEESATVIAAAADLTGAADPMIRAAAAEVLGAADPATKARALAPLLRDPTRLVRMQAARSLAGAGEAALRPSDLAAFEKALDEYVAGQMFTAERPGIARQSRRAVFRTRLGGPGAGGIRQGARTRQDFCPRRDPAGRNLAPARR